MKKLNNKGYMLVEIILASVIAFGVAYFIVDLTLKLKNRNDDVLVETEVTTDKSIITNRIMKYIENEQNSFNCSNLTSNNQTIAYKGNTIDIVNDYTIVGDIECEKDTGQINIKIPLEVRQMKEKDYDVYINYKYEIGDMVNPTCKLEVSGTSVSFAEKTDPGENSSGIDSFGLVKGETTTPVYNNNDSVAIGGQDTYTGFVKDKAGNEGSCTASIITKPGPSSYIKTTYTCVDNNVYTCYVTAYYNQYTSQYFCQTIDENGQPGYHYGAYYCPEIVVNGTPGCCKANQTFEGCNGWTIIAEKSTSDRFAWSSGTSSSVTSCSEANASMVCNATNRGKTKNTCTATGGGCPSGYTELGSYCYKIN